MKAFTIDGYDAPLHEVDLLHTPPGTGQVAIRLIAAGVNHADERARKGEFKALFPLTFPAVLGGELSGEVTGVGHDVEGFAIGDKVYAYTGVGKVGAFAEEVVVDAAAVAHAPSSIPTVEAAALPVGALTAWQALVDMAHLTTGQTILVHGGAGGVGSLTIQLAKHLGATVATTASSKNADFVRSLGADIVIDYRTEEFVDVLADHPVDVVLDTQGGETLKKSLEVLRPGGVAIGISGPPDAPFAEHVGANIVVKNALRLVSTPIRKRARSLGVTYRFLFIDPDGNALREIAALVDDGVLTPNVDRVLPFEQTPQALKQVLAGGTRGKVIVTTDHNEVAPNA